MPSIFRSASVLSLFVFRLFLSAGHSVAGSTMEGVALYWHFVDVIWVTVYALIYLPGLA